LNSVLQCLINDPCFQENLTNDEVLTNIVKDLEPDFTINEENLHKKYNLLKINNYFQTKFPRFQQHDAHEFLLEFLDKLSLKYFTGTIKTCITCTNCNEKSTRCEEFTTIDLYTKHDNLVDNFMEYLQKENIHEYCCEKCNNKTLAVKKTYLEKINTHLIIVLKKYSQLKERLKYPFENLKIRETSSHKIFNYSLYAVIYHVGNHDNGHYNCNVKINNSWYFMDDENIFLNEKMKYDNNNTYILFYKIN